jgi:hypothetical protein
MSLNYFNTSSQGYARKAAIKASWEDFFYSENSSFNGNVQNYRHLCPGLTKFQASESSFSFAINRTFLEFTVGYSFKIKEIGCYLTGIREYLGIEDKPLFIYKINSWPTSYSNAYDYSLNSDILAYKATPISYISTISPEDIQTDEYGLDYIRISKDIGPFTSPLMLYIDISSTGPTILDEPPLDDSEHYYSHIETRNIGVDFDALLMPWWIGVEESENVFGSCSCGPITKRGHKTDNRYGRR